MSKKNEYPKKPKKNLDSYHYHEACDRTYLVVNLINDILMEHPVFQEHKTFRKKIDQITDDLISIYQVTGALQSKKMDEEENNSKSDN
jgi:hypothetical protein